MTGKQGRERAVDSEGPRGAKALRLGAIIKSSRCRDGSKHLKVYGGLKWPA